MPGGYEKEGVLKVEKCREAIKISIGVLLLLSVLARPPQLHITISVVNDDGGIFGIGLMISRDATATAPRSASMRGHVPRVRAERWQRRGQQRTTRF